MAAFSHYPVDVSKASADALERAGVTNRPLNTNVTRDKELYIDPESITGQSISIQDDSIRTLKSMAQFIKIEFKPYHKLGVADNGKIDLILVLSDYKVTFYE